MAARRFVPCSFRVALSRRALGYTSGLVLAVSSVLLGAAQAAEELGSATAARQRMTAGVELLASDEYEGRGVGTQGIDLAADYLAEQFQSLGLKTSLYDGTPFQTFTMTTGAELGKKNSAVLVGPEAGENGSSIKLRLGDDFRPLAIGGSGKIDLPLVFAGYGITAKDEGYDDYEGLDVEGKAVVILRHEPQQNNPHSAFNGTDHSQHAPFTRKLSNAYEHGAAAVIFVTSDVEIEKRIEQRRGRWEQAVEELQAAYAEFQKIEQPSREQLREQQEKIDKLAAEVVEQGKKLAEEYDPVLAFEAAGTTGGSKIPVMHCSRAVLDRMFKQALGHSLAELEAQIDQGPKPRSQALEGWRIQGELTVHRTESQVKNVIAVLEGEGPLADETIIVGAHYDHLGWGGPGSFVPKVKEVHNGADDNASGTVALLEVARRLAAGPKLPRRVVFIAFTGEESGLLGSAHYCNHPLVPLDDTVAMLNMDMVGRLDERKLIVQGADTAEQFAPLLDDLNERLGFVITKKPGGFGPSDHASFYAHDIPVMHFFTGVHKDYHRPSDDADKVNYAGIVEIAQLVADMTARIAQAEERPTYVEAAHGAAAMGGGGGGDRPYFGSIPDFAQAGEGYALSGVTKGSPADKAGLKAGDVIIRLGESRIGSLEDFDSALRKYKAGDKVPVVVRRDKEEVTLTVTLDPPRE